MMNMDSISEKILLFLLEQDKPCTSKAIANSLNISSRTVLRKMNSIEDYLFENKYNIIRKPGYGIFIKETQSQKYILREILLNNQTRTHYSIKERQDYILIELLKAKEPIKIFKFSDELSVTESTISNDLDRIEKTLFKYNINTIRRPGYGVFIEGSEENYRKLIVSLIYENKLDNEILSFIGTKSKKNNKFNTFEREVNNRLLNVIDSNSIRFIQTIINKIENSTKYKLSDVQYVSLIVHLTLTIERIRSGDNIKIDSKYLTKFKSIEEYEIGEFIALEIEKKFNIKIPEDEICYITMHLMGTDKKVKSLNYDDIFYLDRYKIIKTSRNMLKKASEIENIDFLKDDILCMDFARHLEIAIKRINMGLSIRNTLINDIKNNYKKIYNTAEEITKILEKEFYMKVPDDEIGFIAIHLGGSIERLKNYVYKVEVICPSGIGTSRLLATKIDNEFQNIEVLNIRSIVDLERQKHNLENIDFLISTVPLNINYIPWIMVSPLLLYEDIKKINCFLEKIIIKGSHIKYKEENLVRKEFKESLKLKMNYSNAIIEILDNFIYKKEYIHSYNDILNLIYQQKIYKEGGWYNLKKNIEKREVLGEIVLEDLKIIHCRSEEIKVLSVMYIDFKNKCNINNKIIKKTLILLAPKTSNSEDLETMGSISVGFIKNDISKIHNNKSAKIYIETILMDFYENKL